MGQDSRACDSTLCPTKGSDSRYCVAIAVGVNQVAPEKSTINNFAAGEDSEENLIALCTMCHTAIHCSRS